MAATLAGQHMRPGFAGQLLASPRRQIALALISLALAGSLAGRLLLRRI